MNSPDGQDNVTEKMMLVSLTGEEVATMMNAMAYSLADLTNNPQAAAVLRGDVLRSFFYLTPEGYNTLVEKMSALAEATFPDQIALRHVPKDHANPFGGSSQNELPA